MAAVIAAAVDLFAEKGPAATSIRDLAGHSGVNHGLVYRHFGSKEQLVSAVLDHLAEAGAVARKGTDDDMEAAGGLHLRVLAWAILDGYEVATLQHDFPFVTHLVDRARRHGRPGQPDVDARLRAAHAAALELGWRLFEPFLRGAAGLGEVSTKDLRRSSAETARRLLRGDWPANGRS